MHIFSRRIKKRTSIPFFLLLIVVLSNMNCNTPSGHQQQQQNTAHLIMLAPGHFHAALLQKSMNDRIDSTVYVYAPKGQEVETYLGLIQQYNSRPDHPTHWKETVYTGPDYLQKMLKEKPGNLVVLAGNNQKKTAYIQESIAAGLNILADKPMAITSEGFTKLKAAFEAADKKGLLLYDIMTERYEITNMLQKAFSELPDVFGELQKGTADDPAVVFENVHYFYKNVSGKPLIRPAWYFDTDQQGEGIVDVTTHLIDLIQWECFSETSLNYETDVKDLSARHWPTVLSAEEFRKVTGKPDYPDYLKDEVKDSALSVYANGEINYVLKGIHTRVSAEWKFEAPAGAGDTYHALLRGSKANLVLRQGKQQAYKPVLYIEPIAADPQWDEALKSGLAQVQKTFPGIELEKSDNGWKVIVPDKYDTGHEQHFSLVINKYLDYLDKGSMPDWEKSFMLTKYYTTTQALKLATAD